MAKGNKYLQSMRHTIMKRQNISSGSPWESKVGYSRAVRVGNHIYVAGTTASDSTGRIIGIGDPYEQTVYILKKIETALHEAGGTLKNVVRTRMYVTDIHNEDEIARAHQEFFGNIKPAATMVEINRLVSTDMLVEIEVEAVISD
jgi:enamine deaminase RidA (YjgF/YER057c/UK114 family)